MYLLGIRTFRLRHRRFFPNIRRSSGSMENVMHLLLFLLFISPHGIPGLQGIADLPESIRVGSIVESCVKGQHTAAFPAIIAPPYVFHEIDVHLPPAITAERTICVHTVRLTAPHFQVEQFHHIPDCKWKFLRVRVHCLSLLLCIFRAFTAAGISPLSPAIHKRRYTFPAETGAVSAQSIFCTQPQPAGK